MTSGPQDSVPAIYMRGGTSRALFFHAHDLPGNVAERESWGPVFAAALGSPDPGGRQLDGLGGGISSLSKVAVIAPPTHADADVDYIFGQVSVTDVNVSYRGNCGNISAAVGPFAIDEGLVSATGDNAIVRIHHVASGKIIRAQFPLVDGKAAVAGDFAIQGVAGTGAPIRLDFLDPAGAATGRLLPTGNLRDTLKVGQRTFEVSMIDAANPVVFVPASSISMQGNESPAETAELPGAIALLEHIRVAAALAMGIAKTQEEAIRTIPNLPLVAILSPPTDDHIADIEVRMISAGQPHKATPLTGAMCLAVGAKLNGSVIDDAMNTRPAGPLRIAHASGILPVDADVVGGEAKSVTVFRTARRLMDGRVYFRADATRHPGSDRDIPIG